MKISFLWSLICVFHEIESARILIWPAEWSHWINMKVIIKELVKRDHDVTVMRSYAYTDFIKTDMPEVNYFDFYVPYEPGSHLESMDKVLYSIKLGNKDEISTVGKATAMVGFWYEQVSMRMNQCEYIMRNNTIMNQLNSTLFDLVLADPSVMCGELIATKMGVPFVYNVRTLPGELQFALSQTPMPLAYVPMINTEFSDRMNLMQRTFNLITYLYQTIGVRLGLSLMDSIVHKYISTERHFLEIVSHSSMWLIRTDFAFEYPRPLMPNVKFIGGFHCNPPRPLENPDLAEWVNNADDGLIVFSMGSMVRSMHSSKSEMIAKVLAKLPQRVIWRYAGDTPKGLGKNTKIMEWIPQNDLIGHPKTKLFLTHGGTNGLYEAIYHGVPMLGLPLLVDQFDNMLRVSERGAGLYMDITKLTEEDLYHTILELLSNPSYKESSLLMSEVHKDKAMTPLESAVYWIEYTIRTKGAHHLRPAAHDLYWWQYLMLDAIALIALSIYGLYKIIPILFNIIFNQRIHPLSEKQKTN